MNSFSPELDESAKQFRQVVFLMKNKPVKFTVELFKPLLFVGNHVSNYTILTQGTKKLTL